MTTWRLILPIQAAGSVQMAIDRWLFEQHLRGHLPPTLRFYTWHPVAISLGYHQHQYPPHWDGLSWEDQAIALVRRPTGGRAVLHQGDFTYGIVLSGLPTQRRQGYEYVCEFLIQGWRSLGIDLSYGQAGRGYIRNPNCFGSATAADLVMADGAKLIGSAQVRRGDTALQHGSMPLNQNADLFRTVFQVEPHFPDLPSRLALAPHAIAAALIQAASQHFGVVFQEQPLSATEWQQITQQITRELVD